MPFPNQAGNSSLTAILSFGRLYRVLTRRTGEPDIVVVEVLMSKSVGSCPIKSCIGCLDDALSERKQATAPRGISCRLVAYIERWLAEQEILISSWTTRLVSKKKPAFAREVRYRPW